MSRKGPDTKLFYGAALKDSWRFVLSNQRLALKTAGVVLTVTVLHTLLVLFCFWLMTTFGLAAAGAAPQGAPEEGASTIRTVPQFLRDEWTEASWLLWAGIHLILIGWLWHLWVGVIKGTMEKKLKLKRLAFGFVDCLALGFKGIFWTLVYPAWIPSAALVMLITLWLSSGVYSKAEGRVDSIEPVKPQGGFIVTVNDDKQVKHQHRLGPGLRATVKNEDTVKEGDRMSSGFPQLPAPMLIALITMGAITVACMFPMPIAMIHMSQAHTYKAWSVPLMFKGVLINITPSLYWWVIVLVMSSIPAALYGVGYFVTVFGLKRAFGPAHVAVAFARELQPDLAKLTFPWGPVAIYFGVIALCGLVAGYSSLFAFRASGLMAYYFRRRLELVGRTKPGQLAGFWARYAAYLVDILILHTLGPVIEWIELWKGKAIGKLVALLPLAAFSTAWLHLGLIPGIYAVIVVWLPVASFSYFARNESSVNQATIGKEAVGLIVTDLNGQPLTFGKAATRTLLKFVLALVGGSIGWWLAGFTKKKQALHDLMAGTLVVFKGDADLDI